jgi:hypothetical protein
MIVTITNKYKTATTRVRVTPIKLSDQQAHETGCTHKATLTAGQYAKIRREVWGALGVYAIGTDARGNVDRAEAFFNL